MKQLYHPCLSRVPAALCAALLVSGAACSKDVEGTTTPATDEAKAEPTTPAAAAATDNPTADEESTLPSTDIATIFETPVNTLDGDPSSLGEHKGKALLVVNVASKCGLTPQYADLEKLHAEYEDQGFAVVGFPCNQFGGQEPGSAEEIKKFCSLTYGVTFPMFEKIEVNGDNRHPIYTALTKVQDAKGEAGDIQWNFEKFVISADGKSVTRFRPRTEPYDPAILAAIKAGLPVR